MKSVRYLFAIVVAGALSVSAAKPGPVLDPSTLLAAPDGTPQEKYIARYAAIAVSEMYRTGVPASITLAQGLLESRYGLSELAAKGNNHFGIKCHSDWKGRSMRLDDDRKGECFRVYPDADDSFRDHSDFLRYQDRYKFLFDFDIKDYKSWAYGLKKAGYATDPAYPSKLIKLIEDYDLSKFDSMTQAQAGKVSSRAKDTVSDEPVKSSRVEDKARKQAEKKAEKQAEKRVRKSRKEVIPDEIPMSPNSIEQVRQVSRTAAEEFRFSLSREIFMLNGVPFVYSFEGETYASIAAANNLFLKEILAINDLSSEQRLLPGTVVFLQMKKTQAEKGLDKYIVENDGEDLRDICQRFGVRRKSIEKYNGFSAGHVLREGDTIKLRKK